MVLEASSLDIISTTSRASHQAMTTAVLVSRDPLEGATSTTVDAHGWSLGALAAVLAQSSAFSLPVASTDSIATIDSKRIGHVRRNGVIKDLAAFAGQEVVASGASVESASEASATERGRRITQQAHYRIDEGIVAYGTPEWLWHGLAVLESWCFYRLFQFLMIIAKMAVFLRLERQ